MEKLEEYRWPVLKALTISLFFLYFFIKGRLLGSSDFYGNLNLIFGVYYYFLILYPLLLASSLFINNKKKERVLKIRLFSGILFFFFCTFFILMGELASSTLTGRNLEQQLVEVAWTGMNLGGISTSIMHFLYFNVDATLLHRIVIGGISLTAFILFAKKITDSIRYIIRMAAERSERRELQKKEEELLAKITIKEEIDKKMIMKKQRSLRQQEENIQQQVDKFMKREDETVAETYEEEVEGPQGLDEASEVVVSLEDLVELAKNQKEKDHGEGHGEQDEHLEEISVARRGSSYEGEGNDTSI